MLERGKIIIVHNEVRKQDVGRPPLKLQLYRLLEKLKGAR